LIGDKIYLPGVGTSAVFGTVLLLSKFSSPVAILYNCRGKGVDKMKKVNGKWLKVIKKGKSVRWGLRERGESNKNKKTTVHVVVGNDSLPPSQK
jgi:hypothetical protein